jgi:hypothetical protein
MLIRAHSPKEGGRVPLRVAAFLFALFDRRIARGAALWTCWLSRIKEYLDVSRDHELGSR